MAVIKPFRAVRYSPQQISDMQTVVSQPYDRITADLQTRYYELSPYNVVRIIEGRAQPGDDPLTPGAPNVYTRARAYYEQWLDEGVLMREEQPAFYAYEQTFSVEGAAHSRLGLIAAVELVNFDQGIILPHERIHAGPKEDRLRLLNALEANTEQIFILYPDDENRVNALIRQAIANRAPDIDTVELFESDVRQRVWAIIDPAIVAAIEAEMAPKRGLIIADGHHRYSTGLTYRDQQRATHPGAPANAAFNFVAATLVSMSDPGLVVLPTHREIHYFDRTAPADIVARAADHFTVERAHDLETTLQRVNAHPAGHTFGFYGGANTGYYVMTLARDTSPSALIAEEHSDAWKELAVSILHKVLLERVAGVPESGIEDKSMIRYHRDPRAAVASVDQGAGRFVFFVSSTRMEDIKRVAGQGEQMPQKSTDFYPKVISGIVMLPVGPTERL